MSISKFYFHDATTGDTGTLPSSQVYTQSVISTRTGANTNRSADATIGTSEVSCGIGVQHAKGYEFMRRFVSAPLAAQSFSGTVTYEGCFSQNYASAGPVGSVGVSIWRPSTGSKVSEFAYPIYASLGSFSTSKEWLVPQLSQDASGSSSSGDILVFEVFAANDAETTPDYSANFYFDGTTESSTTSAASFITFSNPVLMEGEGAVVWVSPADTVEAAPGDALVWTSVAATKRAHFKLQIASDSGFSSGLSTYYSYANSGFEYWDGSAWQTLGATGMPSNKTGNDVRYTATSGLSGTKYRRVAQTA